MIFFPLIAAGALPFSVGKSTNAEARVNDGSGILFGFLEPKRYSVQRVKTPKI
jgi:hypothetical protein